MFAFSINVKLNLELDFFFFGWHLIKPATKITLPQPSFPILYCTIHLFNFSPSISLSQSCTVGISCQNIQAGKLTNFFWHKIICGKIRILQQKESRLKKTFKSKVHLFLKQYCARSSVYQNKVFVYYSWLIGFMKSTLL